MKFKCYHSLVKESFNIQNLLTREENQSLSFDDVLDLFRSYGGSVIGSGAYATVLSYPSWNYVLKIFSDDNCYLKYVRFCMRNQNNTFVPKLLDKPRRITPTYKRRARQQNLYTVKMEKLQGIPSDVEDHYSIGKMIYAGMLLNSSTINLKEKTPESVDNYIKSDFSYEAPYMRNLKWNSDSENLFNFVKTLKGLFPSCSLDLHSDNFLLRSSGSIVLSDPFSTPYNNSTWKKRLIAKMSEGPYFDPSDLSKINRYDSEFGDKFISGRGRVKFESFNSTLKIRGKFETAKVEDSESDDDYIGEKTVLKSVQIIPFFDSEGNEYLWYARQSRYSDSHWEVAFGKVKSFAPLTGYQLDVNPVRTNEYFKILSTVVEICNRFVQFDSDYTNNSVHTVSFTSKGDNRTNLYLKRLLPKIEDFQLSETSKEGDETTVILNRTKFW